MSANESKKIDFDVNGGAEREGGGGEVSPALFSKLKKRALILE